MCKNEFIVDLLRSLDKESKPVEKEKKTPVQKLDQSADIQKFISQLKIQDEA